MTLSVILIGWNSLNYLQQCLPSLEKSISDISHEIIYIDNASEDGTLSYISQNFSSIKYILNEKNVGVSKARNQGIRMASGQYVWILDSDTIVNPEAVKALFDYMSINPETGICTCKLLDDEGDIQNSFRKYPTISAKLKSALYGILKKMHIFVGKNDQDEYAYDISENKAIEVDYVIGACQFIRHEVFDQIGLLDEKIFYGPEDADFCLRAHQAGWKIIYLPYINITHSYQRVTTRKIFGNLTFQHIKALIYYFIKHKGYGLSGK